MLDTSGFHPEHLGDLRKSGLSDETIEQAGLYSVRPNDIKKVTGLAKVESMLAIPYTPEFSRYKVFPTTLKVQGKKHRYTQPHGSGVHIYVPPAARAILQDATIPLGIVEGEKKALKACQEGLMCVAIGGLWNWLDAGRLTPELKEITWKGRHVTLYPDSDVWKRQDLLEAVYRLGQALEAEGAEVDVCALGNGPGETKQGLDDFLCDATTDDLKGRPHIPLTHARFAKAAKKIQARDHFGKPKRTPVRRGKKLADLLAKVFPIPRAIVEKMILEGLMLLAGKPKLGKSRLMLDIAIAVACGGKALGHLPVDAGPVLYISLEDPERRLQSRIQTMLTGCRAPENFEYETEWPRVDEGGLEDLDLWIQEHPGARLIVIDTLKRMRPKPKPGQSVYDADYEALQGLADLCHKHEGLAVVIVHHTNKLQDAEDFADLISGSTGLPGSADGFAVLRRKRGEGSATLSVVHRDLPEDQEHALRSDSLTGGWTFLGAAQDQPTSPEQREILDVLADTIEPLMSKDIADILSKKPAAVRFLLWKMEQAGLVARVRTGRYALPSREEPLSVPTTTNNANKSNSANGTNSANNRSVVSGPSGGRIDTPDLLAMLVVDKETANSPEPAPVQGFEPPVSVVSDVSSEEEEWIHDEGYTCDECGGHQGEAQPSGRLICLDCLKLTDP
jgi:hypothetical protein